MLVSVSVTPLNPLTRVGVWAVRATLRSPGGLKCHVWARGPGWWFTELGAWLVPFNFAWCGGCFFAQQTPKRKGTSLPSLVLKPHPGVTLCAESPLAPVCQRLQHPQPNLTIGPEIK